MNKYLDYFFDAINTAKSLEFGVLEFTISVCFSLIFGILIMLIYNLYNSGNLEKNETLARSFVLMAPSVTSIFWAIQYSLPLSLGLLGALSFVRFRAPIKSAEDMSFILVIISLGLLSSIYRMFAAVIFVIIIFVYIIVKKYSELKKINLFGTRYNYTLFVETKNIDFVQLENKIYNKISKTIKKLTKYSIELRDIIHNDDIHILRFRLTTRSNVKSILSRIYTVLNETKMIHKVELFANTDE